MTLSELGEEYIEQSNLLKKQIANHRPQLKRLKGDELRELRRHIGKLYEMSLDCRRIGEYLKTYYD